MSSANVSPLGELARFVAELSFERLPEGPPRLAERCFIDTTGVIIAGSREEAGEIAGMLTQGNDGPATILGQGRKGPITEASFVNATSGHSLDFDDTCALIKAHPSVTTIPPLLAVGEARGVTGSELVTAFVAGFEAQCYVGAPIAESHNKAGWHTTATLGTFGAAAATASLCGLTARETHHALGIATSMPAGLKRNFGSMTKPMHAGQAARSGVTAALLAEQGFTADADPLTGDGGFYSLYSGTDEAALEELYELGEEWATIEHGVNVKKFPCCYMTHSGITIALEFADLVSVAEIEQIEVEASPLAHEVLSYDDPETETEARFSMHHALASALLEGEVTLESFKEHRIFDDDVQGLRSAIAFEEDYELSYDSFRTTVTVTTANETFSRSLEKPPGTHDNPLPEEDLREKFLMCATTSMDESSAVAAYEHLNTLRDQDDLEPLLSSLPA